MSRPNRPRTQRIETEGRNEGGGANESDRTASLRANNYQFSEHCAWDRGDARWVLPLAQAQQLPHMPLGSRRVLGAQVPGTLRRRCWRAGGAADTLAAQPFFVYERVVFLRLAGR